ncbi:MAG: response regulator [Anaerolineae bacterium]|nr:response regulator [Anaerolineae bacterium]MDW8101611.1 response regulator [Anaerolineae bacterium]
MPKILLVDDDPKAVKLMGYILYKEGYEIAPALSGREALELLSKEKFDLIILDIMMPEMDGYEVCRRIRANPSTAKIPVIMLTAKAMPEDRIAGYEAGADHYITKPVLPAELVATVKALLARTAVEVAKGKVVTFIGVKGGVGVTSLAVNVGVILAKEGLKSILLDMQPYGLAVASQLGLPISRVDPSFLKMKPQDISRAIAESFLTKHASGLLVFPSIYPDYSIGEIPQEFVRKLVQTLTFMSDYLLIDGGARIDRAIEVALRDSDKVVLVLESDPLSLKVGNVMIKELGKLGVGGLKLIVVSVNRTRAQIALSKQEQEAILGSSIDIILPPAPELFFQSTKEGIPAVILQPSSLAAEQIRALASMIKGKSS